VEWGINSTIPHCKITTNSLSTVLYRDETMQNTVESTIPHTFVNSG